MGDDTVRIPTDISLARYIRELIQADEIYKFYKSNEWIELRQETLHEYHYECQECLKQGRYTRADCVHHINEVKNRPDLALSKYYTDEDGNTKKNLMPLCNRCHNDIHDKLGEWQRRDKFTNTERW